MGCYQAQGLKFNPHTHERVMFNANGVLLKVYVVSSKRTAIRKKTSTYTQSYVPYASQTRNTLKIDPINEWLPLTPISLALIIRQLGDT